MSLLDLFRSPPAPKPAPPAPVLVPERQETGVAVMEPPVPAQPSPEELERQRQEEVKAEAARKLQLMLDEIQREQVAVEHLPAQYASPGKSRSSAQVQLEIQQNTELRAVLEARFKESVAALLPVEASLRSALENEYNSRSGKAYNRIQALQRELVQAKLDEQYQPIDMSFMKKRKWSQKHQCVLPLFAMFDIDNASCIMEGHSTRGGHTGTINQWSLAQPQILLQLCSETTSMLQKRAMQDIPSYSSQAYAISAKFAGAIPADVRKQIAAAKPQFEHVYLVTESPEWELEHFKGTENGVRTHLHTPPIPQQRDPLVIGEKQGKFWLIAAFDTTPAEEYVRKEFTLDRVIAQE